MKQATKKTTPKRRMTAGDYFANHWNDHPEGKHNEHCDHREINCKDGQHHIGCDHKGL